MADPETARSRLIEIVKARSLRTGAAIKLASGKTSTFYVNLKPTMLDPEGAHLIADLILDELSDAGIDLVGGMEMGAVPLAACVAAASHTRGPRLRAFFVRKQAKDHGSKERVEGVLEPGWRVAIVDDVLTTGGSALEAVKAVEERGAVVAAVVCIVDRLQGAREAIAPKYDYRPLFTIRDFGIEPPAGS